MKASVLDTLTVPLSPPSAGTLVTLTLNRPESGNALNRELIDSLTTAFKEIAKTECRAVILTGRGRHFCTGADLGWMQAAQKLTKSENHEDAARFEKMLAAYAMLPMPTLAIVRGSAYGGALGLLAASDIVLATAGAKFSLSEVRLGLFPAMILRYLQKRVAPGPLTRLALTARVVDAEFAREIGLVHVVASDNDIQAAATDELNLLLAGAPHAQSRFKSLARDLSALAFSDRQAIQESRTAIAEARTGSEGQAGLKSFFDKSPPPWRGAIPKDWKIPWD